LLVLCHVSALATSRPHPSHPAWLRMHSSASLGPRKACGATARGARWMQMVCVRAQHCLSSDGEQPRPITLWAQSESDRVRARYEGGLVRALPKHLRMYVAATHAPAPAHAAAKASDEGPRTMIDGVVNRAMRKVRMPVRCHEGIVVDASSSTNDAQPLRHAQRRATSTAARLRAQHRPVDALPPSRCDDVLFAKDVRGLDFLGGLDWHDAPAGGSEFACCVCHEGFETQDGCGDSSVHLRATLTGCGHSFCSPCLAEILRFQGVHCSELGGAASQSCSNCQREQFKTSSRGGAGDDHDVVLRQCKGWAPCPLCRHPYCEEQVVVSRTH